jgi:hypothetical protein
MFFETHMFADAVISFLHDSRGAQTVLLIAQDTKVTKKISPLCSIHCTADKSARASMIAISPTFVDMCAWHHSSELIV